MSTAFAYTRVSGKGQMEGHGLQRQHDVIRKFAACSGYQLTGVYSEEGISGTKGESSRPAFQRMLDEMTKARVSPLLTYSWMKVFCLCVVCVCFIRFPSEKLLISCARNTSSTTFKLDINSLTLSKSACPTS